MLAGFEAKRVSEIERVLPYTLQDLVRLDRAEIKKLIPYERTDFAFVPIMQFERYHTIANLIASQIHAPQDIFYGEPASPTSLTGKIIEDLKCSLPSRNTATTEDLITLAPIINNCLTLCAKLSGEDDIRARLEINNPTQIRTRMTHYDGNLWEENKFLVLFIPDGPQTLITPEENVIERIPGCFANQFLSAVRLKDPDDFQAIPKGYLGILRLGRLATAHKAAIYDGLVAHRSRFFLGCIG